MIAFAFGLGTAFDNPARQSFVSEVAGPDHLPNAIGLNSATFHAARIVGPALAGLVIAAVGSGWAILVNALSYAAFIGALLMMDSRLLRTTPRSPRAKRQIREALTYIRSKPNMVLVMCVVFFVGTFGLNFQMMSVLMAQQEFQRSAQAYGILVTLAGAGALAGALLAARRRSRPSARLVVGMALTFGVVDIVEWAGAQLRGVRGNPAGHGPGHAPHPDCGQCLDPTRRRSIAARPRHGAVHHGADGRHSHRLADPRLGRRECGSPMGADRGWRGDCGRSTCECCGAANPLVAEGAPARVRQRSCSRPGASFRLIVQRARPPSHRARTAIPG